MRRYHRKYKRHEREERKADKCGIKKCEICGKEIPMKEKRFSFCSEECYIKALNSDFYKKEKGKIC